MKRKRYGIRFRVFGALVIMAVGTGVILSYILFSLDESRENHRLLTQVNQLESIATRLGRKGRDYLTKAPRDYDTYYRDVAVFHELVQQDIAQFEETLSSLNASVNEQSLSLPAKIFGTRNAIQEPVVRLRETWDRYREGFSEELGPDPEEPRLEWGAEFMAAHDEELVDAVERAARQLREANQTQAIRADMAVNFGLAALGLLAAGGSYWFYRRIIRPVEQTAAACRELATGRFGHQMPTPGKDELGDLAEAFNTVSARMHGIVLLLDEIQQGGEMDDVLDLVWIRMADYLPLSCMVLLEVTPDRTHAVVSHIRPDALNEEMGAREFPLQTPAIASAMESHAPTSLDLEETPETAAGPFARRFADLGVQSALVAPLAVRGQTAYLLVLGSDTPRAYNAEHVELIRNLGPIIAHSFEKTSLTGRLLMTVINGLTSLAENRDPETGDHLIRMSLYSEIIARQLMESGTADRAIDAAYIRDIRRYAPTHDIGKVGISDLILLKNGPLTDEERREMQKHPEIGGQVLRNCAGHLPSSRSDMFDIAIEIAEGHHERFDGTGYPRQWAGRDIPLSARIIAAADVFDALTSKRPYKRAWSIEEALELMQRESGHHFDPVVVNALLASMDRIRAVYDEHKHV